MPVRGLTLIVAEPDPVRFRAALRLAAAAAALGRPTRLLLDEEAVPAIMNGDTQPLLAAAWELGTTVILCQTGLAAAELDLRALDSRFTVGGLVGLLAELGDDQLVTV